jgi:hypothetical protein
VAEVLDDQMTFNAACLEAMRAFRRGKPWLGNFQKRACKLHALNRDLSRAYRLDPAPQLVCVPHGAGQELARRAAMSSLRLFGVDCYDGLANRIELHADPNGHLSVVTYLHEFGHARGLDEWQTCRWSVNLFRRIFPRSFERLEQVGHRLLRVRLALSRPAPEAGPLAPRRDQHVSVRRLDRPALPGNQLSERSESGSAGSNATPSAPMQKVNATSVRSPRKSTTRVHSGHW